MSRDLSGDLSFKVVVFPNKAKLPDSEISLIPEGTGITRKQSTDPEF